MLGMFTRIDEVSYKNGPKAFLLTGSDIEGSGFEVDLKSDLWFNTEFEVEDRSLLAEIKSTSDILSFAKAERIKIDRERMKNGEILVGGEKDCIVHADLSFEWI